jgi:1-deoxy-D-xylulose-5-phosphate reductoisomerase
VTGVALLGSTGSIGLQTLAVLGALPGQFDLRAIAARRQSDAFVAQLAAFAGARAWCEDGRPGGVDASRWADGGLAELAVGDGIDLVVVATTGMAALPAVLAALRAGRRVALANKETLVTGGHLVARELDAIGGDRLDRLRPIDSEHSAIWQCLLGEPIEGVARLILTASGGPFRNRNPSEAGPVTIDQALMHPTWKMGPKITIDSATLVNKAFEAIEARWLYGVPYPRIEAVIHPQSVVHSLVEFTDGSFKAQLGLPDMRLPIQYALTYPDRMPSPIRRSGPTEWGSLEFTTLDEARFPAYRTVRSAAAAGGNRGTILNAADEVAVERFLAGSLPFDGIPGLIATAVERWGSDAEPELDAIQALDAEVRSTLSAEIGRSVDA